MSDSGMTEDERRERVRMIVESAPDGVDIESTLAGVLVGPESTDRPDVPMWEYVEYAATHPDVTLHDLGAVRFPIRNARLDTTYPTSIDELLKPGNGHVGLARTRRDIVDLFAVMHEAGLLRWEAATRTIVQVEVPSTDAAALHAAWQDRIAGRLGS
ncbi:hypothetical protein [Pengzhenrongella sp.]|uniref:hypothetical protein n=1 Tax=Pengzhenrongella sp. TaxID=2888820 RepID=UPI002F95A658